MPVTRKLTRWLLLRPRLFEPSHQRDSQVTALADGGYIVTWRSLGQTSTYGVYMRRFNASGAAMTGDVNVYNHSSVEDQHPAVAALSNGNTVHAFATQSPGALADGSGYAVMIKMYDPSGSFVSGSHQRVNSHIDGDQYNPRIGALTDGGFVVIWQSNGQDGDGFGVYGQRYDAAGNTVGGGVPGQR